MRSPNASTRSSTSTACRALPRPRDGTGDEAPPDRARALIASLPGGVAEVSYDTGGGGRWFRRVGDVKYLAAWPRHPGFHPVEQHLPLARRREVRVAQGRGRDAAGRRKRAGADPLRPAQWRRPPRSDVLVAPRRRVPPAHRGLDAGLVRVRLDRLRLEEGKERACATTVKACPATFWRRSSSGSAREPPRCRAANGTGP
ncbi:DUF6368 family protein [Streptomyces sp. NPDC003314]